MSKIQLHHQLAINARVLDVPSNGQKRVAYEVSRRFAEAQLVRPKARYASGSKGHLWEQVVLSRQTRQGNLWSPSTTGPVYHPNHVVTVHDIAFVDQPDWFSRSFATVYDLVVARLVRHARHIITVSNFTRERLIEHYGAQPDRVSCVYSGTSDSFQRIGASRATQVVRGLGVPDGPFLVAFRGHDPRKNFDRVIAAWKTVSRRHPEARLVTFGRVSNAKVFAGSDVVELPESVIHVGPVEDYELACLYSASNGLVFPSLYEGFGLPVVEAAACGTAVLTSNLSALPEVSPDDALLVDPQSVSDITQAMDRMITTPPDPVAISQRIKSSRRFDWDKTAAQYADIFGKVFS